MNGRALKFRAAPPRSSAGQGGESPDGAIMKLAASLEAIARVGVFSFQRAVRLRQQQPFAFLVERRERDVSDHSERPNDKGDQKENDPRQISFAFHSGKLARRELCRDDENGFISRGGRRGNRHPDEKWRTTAIQRKN